MIKRLIGKKIRYIQRHILWKIKNEKDYQITENAQVVGLFEKYRDFTFQNKGIKYSLNCLPDIDYSSEYKYKWVGAQIINDTIIGIPNDACSFLLVDGNTYSITGKLKATSFKWTGGQVINGKLYCFPRTENFVLVFDINSNQIMQYCLGTNYQHEHHYGGVLINNSFVIQPPRNCDHFLVWNINDFCAKKIRISPLFWKMQFRYSASVLHPNGFVYFIPENEGRVIKFDTKSFKWNFIGKELYSTVFDAKIAVNGNIYGFSSTTTGIIKIDTKLDNVEIIHQDKFIGAYGTKLGINGKMYSIPGNGNKIWEFDPITETLIEVFEGLSDEDGKYAGGLTKTNGNIVAVPSHAKNVLFLNADWDDNCIPDELYEVFYMDTY